MQSPASLRVGEASVAAQPLGVSRTGAAAVDRLRGQLPPTRQSGGLGGISSHLHWSALGPKQQEESQACA